MLGIQNVLHYKCHHFLKLDVRKIEETIKKQQVFYPETRLEVHISQSKMKIKD